MIFLLLITLSSAAGCHPLCSWLCDDPTCPAVCQPICSQPACQFNQTCGYSPVCSVRCPADQCESDSCPACETICADPPSLDCGVIECEITTCSWQCRKPLHCPYPRCELQCEHPACEYVPPVSDGASMLVATWGMMVVLALLL